jgi:thymidylate synthase (FAD)
MKVELLNHFGDDLMIVNAARVSYDKESKEFSDKDAKLIKFLIDHKHMSPLRHPQLQFRIECPIYVERQLFKHQVGLTANSISGRYVDFSDEYEQPTQYRYQSKDSKQGSSGNVSNTVNEIFVEDVEKLINEAKRIYNMMVDFGIAKEQARCHLPLCLMTKFIWTGSLAAFIHLFNLRLKPDTQQETRDIAQIMLHTIHQLPNHPFKNTLEALGYGR